MPKNYRTYPALAMDEIMDTFANASYRSLEPINFGKGVSSFNPFDHVHAQLTSTDLGEQVGYGDIKGLLSLRQAICRHYQENFDYDLSPDRVCITDGASGALTIALAMLLEKGGEIILPESCYPAYAILTQVFGGNCRFAPLRDNFCIDIEQLPSLISNKTQAILINSPSNPHGTFLRADELDAVTNLAVPVIFDEVYQSLSLVDEPIPSAIQFSDRHLIVSSLSKSLAIAGFRVGYLIVPEQQIKLMTNVKAILNMCTSLPSQTIAETLMGHWDSLIDKHRAMLRNNWSTFKYYSNHLGLKLRSQPEAGFFAMVDVSEAEQNDMQVALELAKYHGMSSSPGIDFQDDDAGFLRLNFACHTQQIETGLTRLANYLACPKGAMAQLGAVKPNYNSLKTFTRSQVLEKII